MLAGLGGADGVLGMHGVGQGDIDGIDGGVVGDLVEVVVVIDGVGRDVVLGGDAGCFFGMTADQRGDARVGGEQDAGKEVSGDLAETDDGVADLAVGGRRDFRLCGSGGGGRVLSWGTLGTEGWSKTGGKREGQMCIRDRG